MYPGCNFYGIKKILLRHAKLPAYLPLPIAVQHGWQRIAHDFESSSKPPEIWVWSERIAKDLEKFYPKKKIRVIGSFFIYCLSQIKDQLPPKPARGSICIPTHSSYYTEIDHSAEYFASELLKLEDKYHPITIMLYYLDMKENIIDAYKKHGFSIISNGSIYDDNFIINFIKNTYDKKYCIFSDLGSGVFFASHMGLDLKRVSISSKIKNSTDKYATTEYIEKSSEFDKKIIDSIDSEITNDELGVSYMPTSSELKKLIIKNYLTKRFTITIIKKLLQPFFSLFRKLLRKHRKTHENI